MGGGHELIDKGQMIILEEEVQDQGGGEEALTTEKHDLSHQVLPPDLPSASPPTSCLCNVG